MGTVLTGLARWGQQAPLGGEASDGVYDVHHCLHSVYIGFLVSKPGRGEPGASPRDPVRASPGSQGWHGDSHMIPQMPPSMTSEARTT